MDKFGFLVFALCIQGLVVAFMKKMKQRQHIYALSPQSHQGKKGTPTMGGIGILISTFSGLFWFQIHNPALLWCSALLAVFCGIGFLDDYLSLKKKANGGLTAKQKFGLQSLFAMIFVLIFNSEIAPLSWLSIGTFIFAIVGASNATNLSDGLDGLLAGLSITTMTGFYVYFEHFGSLQDSQFCLIILSVLLAFLAFNIYPAKIFMGDTGSLGLGALFAGLSLIAGKVWILIILGAVYIIETLCVILQVAYYKKTKKRIFLMAPLHHHFELLGLKERQVVWIFWATGALFLALFLKEIL